MTESYDGRAVFRRTGGAPKPKRFDEMVAASAAGDEATFQALCAEYRREAGIVLPRPWDVA